MKIGFSSVVCPDWDLETILSKAVEAGFTGVELHVSEGKTPLGELARDPDDVRRRFAEKNVEIVCLSTSIALDSCMENELASARAAIEEVVELAAQLACPFVRIPAGELQVLDNKRFAVSRIAAEVAQLVPSVTRHNVTLLVENGGDLPGSEALWFVADAVNHPAVKVCWSQCTAMTLGERATVSLPRMSTKLGLVHITDAEYDRRNLLSQYKLPGQGQTEVAKQIELLKGLMYDGYLVFVWPKAQVESLPEPEVALPEASAFLRACLDSQQDVLSAYKIDKRKVKFASRIAAVGQE